MASGVGWLQDKIFGEYQDEDTQKETKKPVSPPPVKKKGLGGGVGWLQDKLSGPYEDADSTPVEGATQKPGAASTHPAVPFDPASNLDQASPAPKARVTAKPTPRVAATKARPSEPADTMAPLRADLLANAQADKAAMAKAEQKRKEAEDFANRIKAAKGKGPGKVTGYDSYQSLMGEGA